MCSMKPLQEIDVSVCLFVFLSFNFGTNVAHMQHWVSFM